MGQTLAFGCHTSVHAKARVDEHIPGSLGENFLPRLTAFSVDKNHLTSLPESLWQLTNLRTINVQVLADVMAQAALADVTDAVHVERERQAGARHRHARAHQRPVWPFGRQRPLMRQ